MAQRASLARALVNDPALLLLDEPLGKLDSLTRLTLQGELLSLWRDKGFTAILVTHDVEEAVLLSRGSSCSANGRRASRRNSPSTFPIRATATTLSWSPLRRQILGTLGLET